MTSWPRSRRVSSPWRPRSERHESAASKGVSGVDLLAAGPSRSHRSRPNGPKKTSPAWTVDTRKRRLAKGVDFRVRGVRGVRGHGVSRNELAEPRDGDVFSICTGREDPARRAQPSERGSRDMCGPSPSERWRPDARHIVPQRRLARTSLAGGSAAARGAGFGEGVRRARYAHRQEISKRSRVATMRCGGSHHAWAQPGRGSALHAATLRRRRRPTERFASPRRFSGVGHAIAKVLIAALPKRWAVTLGPDQPIGTGAPVGGAHCGGSTRCAHRESFSFAGAKVHPQEAILRLALPNPSRARAPSPARTRPRCSSPSSPAASSALQR